MDIKLNEKVILDMCGSASFKRGETFYRNNKVEFLECTHYICQATVTGVEVFHVTVEKTTAGIKTKCSCPKLASFEKECQHVAAVLFCLLHSQRHHKRAADRQETVMNEVSDRLLNLFDEETVYPSRQQRYFETRKIVEVTFTLRPIQIVGGQWLASIALQIGTVKVENLPGFLERVKEGKPINLSNALAFHPKHHCFQTETDEVFKQLIQMIDDEKAYGDETAKKLNNYSIDKLIIPPSKWERLLTSVLATPLVKLEYDGQLFVEAKISNELLPLQFDFRKNDNHFELLMNGMNEIFVLNSYQTVLYEGTIRLLEANDCQRLTEIKKMFEATTTNVVPIPEEKLGFFIEAIAPGLKKLGEVTVDETISKLLKKKPLQAKLFLDRVSNRLLAGLEFHYENIIFNPLEANDLPAGTMLSRDTVKEDEILELMEEGEFAKTDGGYFLHNEELEYQFLYHIIPKLEKVVQIYATTAVRNRIYRDPRPIVRVKVNKERTNWLEFAFKLDGISDNEIREVLAALEEKRKYYRLRNGSLMSLQTNEFMEIQRFLASPQVKMKEQELANGLDLPLEKCLHLLDHVEGSRTFFAEESFKKFLETIRNPGCLQFEIPKRVEPILKEYQKHGYQWMKILAYYGFGGILADDMGLGKTLQSITYILSILSDLRKQKSQVLVVCPSSVTYNWKNELMKFAPNIEAVVIDGKKSEREVIQKDLKEIDVVITSYPLLRQDITWYEKQVFHTVFFDEAQAFKNPLTQTARAVKKIKAGHRFALTGTPVENSLEELWSIFHIVFPELFLGLKEYSFLSRETIARRIRPFVLRRVKEEVLAEFPEKIETIESVDLLPEQKQLYAAYLAKLRHDTLKHLDKDTIRKNRIKILAGLTRLRQICCHPGLFVNGYKGSSAKFEQLLQFVDEAKLSGRRVLIFSQFTKMLDLIGRKLTMKGLPFFYLDGQTPSEERVDICNRFNAGEHNFFLISLKAGGTGLNLMSADTVILYDTWWNPAIEEQATDRAHRIGQQNDVQVIKLVARGTIEEKMNELQAKKKHLIEEVLESNREIGTLSVEDLKEILMS
ncbi:SNF2 helicase associated domain-containing protein [Anaerobacillus sp. MEB173]|uniref:DEAD/DEAH box helicase n=1 Tax=Anaerobacillus sp. MEB173 TaxID=3383345 RepID=UPI003F91713B